MGSRSYVSLITIAEGWFSLVTVLRVFLKAVTNLRGCPNEGTLISKSIISFTTEQSCKNSCFEEPGKPTTAKFWPSLKNIRLMRNRSPRPVGMSSRV